jgi:hypothetical protein
LFVNKLVFDLMDEVCIFITFENILSAAYFMCSYLKPIGNYKYQLLNDR